MKKNGLVPPSVGLVDVAPTQSGDGTNPTGLAQPPLSPSVSGKTAVVKYLSFLLFSLLFSCLICRKSILTIEGKVSNVLLPI